MMNIVVTVCLKETKIIRELLEKKLMTNSAMLVLSILKNIYKYYNTYLKEINDRYSLLEKDLNKKIKNEHILQLFLLKKSLVYFRISLKSNEMTLKKLNTINTFNDENSTKIMEEILREHIQTSEMVNTYSSVIDNTISLFSYIISNNSNITMKKLAEITVMLSIPSIIASIFGMNILLPISKEDPKGFIKVCAITLISWIITSITLRIKDKRS